MSRQFALRDSAIDGPESDVLRVHFERQSPVPLFQQLKYHIVHAISTGRLPQGAPLPSVRAAAQALGLAAATVQRTYSELQRDGLIVSESGRGMFVARLEIPSDIEVEGKDGALRDLLLPTILQAQVLGFDAEEIVATVRELVEAGQHGTRPKVIFVGRYPAVAERYVTLLKEGLAGVGCELVGVDFPTITKPGALEEYLPADLLVSMVSQFAQVREIGERYGVPTFGLTVELHDDVKRKIMEIPEDARIGLLVEAEFLSNTRSMVEHLTWASELVAVASEDVEKAREALKGCDWILHSSHASDVAAEIAEPGTNLVKLETISMPAAVVHLAQLLISMRDGRTDQESDG